MDPSSQDETRNWCDLPKAALFLIAKQLDWHTHLARLRGVCPAWRSSLPVSDFPTLTSLGVPNLQPNLPNQLLLTRFYLISHLNNGPRWLARLGEMGHNTWHLFNPLNMHEYFFPSPAISGSINLLDCEIQELASVFSLKDYGPKAEFITKKTVGGLISDYNHSAHPFVLLAQLEEKNQREGSRLGLGLVMFRLGDSQWIEIEETKLLRILDIAFHNNKFYAFDLTSWRVGLIDPANPSAPMEFIAAPEILGDPMDGMFTVTFNGGFYFLRNSFLVPSNESLYLVLEVEEGQHQSNHTKITLIVFRFEEEGKNWEHVENLGDQIFFIGYDVSFSLQSSSKKLPQWKPSSICLFTRPFPMIFDGCYEDGTGKMAEGAELLESVTYAEYWRYFRIFEMVDDDDNGDNRGVTPFEKLSKKVYTGLFFPPPEWVRWRCPSLENVEVRLDGLMFRGDDDDQPFFD